MLQVDERWSEIYPEAKVGLLVLRNVSNSKRPPALEETKRELEQHLRATYAEYDRERLRSGTSIGAYDAYYRGFRKTYHVLLQLETVAFKGESISGPSPLVEAMLMAELDNLLLTAGHDMASVEGPLVATVATGEESYVTLGGREGGTKSGDMMIKDGQGILSTVLYGPDHRTRLRSSTEDVLFTVYAPAGIGAESLQKHLSDLEDYVSLLGDMVERELLEIYP